MNTPAPVPQPPPWWWDKLAGSWRLHGTKIIGSAVSLLGIVAAGDPTVVHYLTALIGTDRAPGVIVAAGGLLTLWRGFQNSANAGT